MITIFAREASDWGVRESNISRPETPNSMSPYVNDLTSIIFIIFPQQPYAAADCLATTHAKHHAPSYHKLLRLIVS